MNCKALVAIFVVVFVPAARSGEPAPERITADVIAVAEGGNQFATDLYGRLHSDKITNMFFSPYSISQALAMTDAGAAGQTGAQIAKVLHFPLPESKVHSAFGTLGRFGGGQRRVFRLRASSRQPAVGTTGHRFHAAVSKNHEIRLWSGLGPTGLQADRSRSQDDQLVDWEADGQQNSGLARSRCHSMLTLA